MAVMVKTDGKNLIPIQVNFVLIPSETGMKPGDEATQIDLNCYY